jgi:hypothetical protein
MELKIKRKLSKNTTITFSKTDNEIRFKIGSNLIQYYETHKDKIINFIRRIETFYITKNYQQSLRGSFLFSPESMLVTLRTNIRKSSITARDLNDVFEISKHGEMK